MGLLLKLRKEATATKTVGPNTNVLRLVRRLFCVVFEEEVAVLVLVWIGFGGE